MTAQELYESILIVQDVNTPLSVIDRMGRQKISKNIKYFNFIEYKNIQINLSFTEYSTPKPHNIYSLQGHMECLARQTILWAIKQLSINLKELKSYKYAL